MEAVREHTAERPLGTLPYARHRPEETLLYQVIDDHYVDFIAQLEAQGRALPKFVRREFEDYLKCGRLEHGFLRLRCSDCHAEQLLAFSGKRRGFCPSCGARRMVESAALLVDEVLPRVPLRQWVLSVPYPLRFLFASNSVAVGEALAIVYRALSGFLLRKAGLTRRQAQCGAVTLIQRFGSALNLNVHFHMLVPDGVYLTDTEPPYFSGA
jgi:ribosomal protein S27E